jgi:membrane peptidoglycan carboxypeptidase
MASRRRKWVLTALLALPLALVLYEGYAVLRARAHTAHALARVAARETPLASVPAHRLRMLLQVEDPSFFTHRGIDLSTPGQGMTTLTQSLAKFLYFDRFTPGFQKLELMLVARFALDPAASKREQLEIFLNHARFGSRNGRPIRGFAAAARAFHGRELAALTDRQFLSLVAMLIAPAEFDPLRHPEANRDRTDRIVALLAGRCRPRGLRDVRYEDCAGLR